MNLKLKIILNLLILLRTSFACYQEFSNHTQKYYGYSRYSRYHYSYNTVIDNSTITCSNIYSVNEIYYTYYEKSYDQFLKITDSNITSLQPNELTQFTTITKLFLSKIHIKKVLPGAFSGLTRLKELYLDNNELTEVSKGVYNSLQKLEILDLSNNKIYQIENLALIGMSALRKLYFQNNNLSKIDNGTFDKLSHLTYLDLSGNPLHQLSVKGLSHLDTFLLARTALTQFGEELSNSNLTIYTLDLSSSKISSVNFSNFLEVDALNFSNNSITTLVNCEKLDIDTVNLNNNQIKSLQCGFKGLSKLFLAHNQLENLDNIFTNKPNFLLYLDLSFNKIGTIEKSIFKNMTYLISLELQNNNITKIDPVLFRNLPNLLRLNLSRNSIEDFQFGTFDGLKELRILDISSNNLVDLHQYTFSSLSKLQELYFDNNKISTFDISDLIGHLPSLELISLNGNNWKCKDLAKIDLLLKPKNVTILEGNNYDGENFRGIACQNEKPAKQNISSFTDEQQVIDEFQKILNESVKNSNLERFLNEDFMNSQFVKFFQENYNNSNFVKFLNNYKFVTPQQEVKETEKDEPAPVELKSAQIESRNGEHYILVFSVLLQVVMCFLLVFIAYLMFSFLKKSKANDRVELLTEME